MPDSHIHFLKPTAIVLDDHRLFADSFANMLENSYLFDKVMVFNQEEALIEFLIKFRNNKNLFLFLDFYLEDRQVSQILNHLKRIQPTARIIIVTSLTNPIVIKKLTGFQLDGIISKTDGISDILDCIYSLKKEETYKSKSILNMLSNAPEENVSAALTNREIEILRHFAKGLTVDATAGLMHLSRHTIAAHRRKMFEKTSVNNIAELLAYARKSELL